MGSTMGIDGLASGLNTTDLINQLMQAESAPQALLKSKQTEAKSLVTALQSLNAKVASLAEAATTAAKPASWSAWKATSSSTAATAAVTSSTSSAATGAGSVTFSVDSVAKNRVAVTAAVPDNSTLVAGLPPTVTVKGADGSYVTVQPTSGSLADVAKALNAASAAGVSATVVRVSNGETPTYRIQFTGTKTGNDGAFEVYSGTQAQVEAGTATRLDTSTVQAATNAKITLWQGTGVEASYEQSSNTFTGLMTGVDVTVSKVTEAGSPVTVSVTRDDAALTKLASGLVGSIGVVLSEISSRTGTTSKTDSDGRTVVSGGLFTGEGSVRTLQQRVIEAASYPVDDVSPSTMGITLAKDGTFSFDETKFAAALAADPAKVQKVVSTLAQRVADVADAVSDKYDGTLTMRIQGEQSDVTQMGTEIEDWDRRLALRKEGLQRTYSALEVTLSNLKSQSTWLTGQLAALNKSSS